MSAPTLLRLIAVHKHLEAAKAAALVVVAKRQLEAAKAAAATLAFVACVAVGGAS